MVCPNPSGGLWALRNFDPFAAPKYAPENGDTLPPCHDVLGVVDVLNQTHKDVTINKFQTIRMLLKNFNQNTMALSQENKWKNQHPSC